MDQLDFRYDQAQRTLSNAKVMVRLILLLLPLWIVAISASHQNYPGTKTRPILSDAEAAQYTKSKYLQGWNPGKIQHSKADYTVGSAHYSRIQEAVNAAIKAGGSQRKYIHIQKGTYKEIVFIPKSTVPITIYGTPGSPGDVVITMSISANTKGSQWANQVNPNGKYFKEGDPAWSMFSSCAKKNTVGACAEVVWGQSDNLEMAYLTINNPNKDGQGVAARFDGDKQNIDHLNLYGFQDTLFLNGKRIYLSNPTIKGDVDFIFGSASAVLEGAQIIGRGDRPRNTGVIFAPNTDKNQKYGFLLINSKITADNNVKSNKGLSLARAWDASGTPNANGQLVIRESEIADVIKVNSPYSPAATSGRQYSGNVDKHRNLDDSHFNRFWEFKNHGAGA